MALNDLNDLESHLFAHYVAHGANELEIAGRWFPYGNLVMTIEDKVMIGARAFGTIVKMQSKAAGKAFLDYMLEKEAFITKDDKFGKLHQFQPDVYRKVLKELQAGNPIVQKAAAEGEGFWAAAFTDLTKA
jgi:hypothetical protein